MWHTYRPDAVKGRVSRKRKSKEELEDLLQGIKLDKEQFMKSKTVIFDMDGVIFDTEKLFLDCWKQIAGRFGMAGIEQVYYRTIGTDARDSRRIFCESYGDEFSYEELTALAFEAFFRSVRENGMPMKPWVGELLNYLAEAGYRIGLASSTKEIHVREQLASRDLLSFFQVIVCGDMVSRSKPAPEIYLKACKDIGTMPKEAFAIEDSYNGVRAAAAAGMKAIMVPDIVPPDAEMKELAYRIYPSLAEVKDFFASLDGS